jgi:hypothetical protein
VVDIILLHLAAEDFMEEAVVDFMEEAVVDFMEEAVVAVAEDNSDKKNYAIIAAHEI